jgi:hypothetical protein
MSAMPTQPTPGQRWPGWRCNGSNGVSAKLIKAGVAGPVDDPGLVEAEMGVQFAALGS